MYSPTMKILWLEGGELKMVDVNGVEILIGSTVVDGDNSKYSII